MFSMKRIQQSNSIARPLPRREATSSFALVARAVLLLAASLSVAGYAGVTRLTPPEEPAVNATTVWGHETNKLQAGLCYEGAPGQSSFGPGTKFVPGIRSLWGKEMGFFWIPPESERYRVSLLDDQGRPVQRTAKGQSVGQPIRKNPVLKRKGGEYEPFWFEPSSRSYSFQSFKPSDFFLVSKPGKYKFEWEMRLLYHNSATNFQTIVLPPVTLDIVVDQPATPR